MKATITKTDLRSFFKGSNRFSGLTPTVVYDTYWRFAAERQAIYMRRAAGSSQPWTSDPILLKHKFTNAYRASDRVSQFFIKHVLYGEKYSSEPKEIVFRTMLFKLFNRVATWTRLEEAFDDLSWQTFDLQRYDEILSAAMAKGERLYSAAYIVPPVRLGPDSSVKHRGHLHLIEYAMKGDLTSKIIDAPSLQKVYELLKELPSFGRFLAFQFAIDLNYSTALTHDESDFVVAGPGALDGISKCFANSAEYEPEDIVEFVQNRQAIEFDRLGVKFESLWGRPLQLIDCQNLFCEISKYSRVAHPEFSGIAGRTRIKQIFKPDPAPLAAWFPPKWHINESIQNSIADPTDLFAKERRHEPS